MDGDDGPFSNIVLTNIDVHVQGRVECGNDMFVYTATDPDGTPCCPDYIMAGDTAGRGIPDAEMYDYDSFQVCGGKIALVGAVTGDHAFGVAVYDPATQQVTQVPLTDIRLINIPIGSYAAGHIQADGEYFITRNDDGEVDDGLIVKVVDCSGAAPAVIAFTNNPAGDPEQVLIDAETHSAIAVDGNVIYVYDIENPTAAPTMFDTTATDGIDSNGTQYAIDDGWMLYQDDTSDRNVYLLDVTDGSNSPVMVNQSAATAATSGNARYDILDDYYMYFYRTTPEFGSGDAAATGIVPGGPDVGNNDTIVGDLTCCGRFSQGDTLAVAMPGSSYTYFVAGSDDLGFVDPVQSSPGGGVWTPFPDPSDPDDNLPLGDVVSSGDGKNLVFKHEIDNDTKLGYVVFD
jgi:hypothetical protein